MKWPPLKAWTSKFDIEGHRHFVAINYGGIKHERWVILMSVLDSSLVVKVPWSELIEESNWVCGWWEDKNYDSSELLCQWEKKIITNNSQLSIDSGLTIPITKKAIRPWFDKN